jgi:hypothetical protein
VTFSPPGLEKDHLIFLTNADTSSFIIHLLIIIFFFTQQKQQAPLPDPEQPLLA